MDTALSPTSSVDDDSDPPATAPLYERIFGKDPTTADDPIVYDIRELHDELTDQEKRDIMNVAKWPESDLRELTAGDPPDADFSNAKPSNQVNFSTFQTYIEPYIRPFTEEDVAFLKERGDRFTPYIIPERGTKHFREVWASEDGSTGIEPARSDPLNPNEPRGCMEDLDDEIAEQDIVSMGPVMSRLLSIIRPQPNAAKRDENNAGEDANGDTTMTNGDGANEANDAVHVNSSTDDHKPISCLPAEFKAPNLPSLDYSILEERALQEFRYIGIIGPNDNPDFDAHLDDEISARLRTLQHELRRISRLNNVRKLRILELTEERMAMQEYANIADDLDNQVNAAYLKRNRSMSKPNSNKKGGGQQARAGQKGVASMAAGRGVSDGVKALMQKRRDWIEMVGPVVSYGRPPIPTDDETIFDEVNTKRLEKIEREAEAGEVEGD
jgi:transcriptional adapter 3